MIYKWGEGGWPSQIIWGGSLMLVPKLVAVQGIFFRVVMKNFELKKKKSNKEDKFIYWQQHKIKAKNKK